MATNKLFSYSVDESDGKLVITVDGLYAQAAVQHLRAEVETGGGWWALSELSPMRSLNRLARRRALGNPVDPNANHTGEIDLDVIFNQGFADTYEDFGKNLDRFADSLVQLKSEFDENALLKQARAGAAKETGGHDRKTAVK
jgi:hypothetical protein